MIELNKKKYLFSDLNGTLIGTISGYKFAKGLWDMEFLLNVWDAIKAFKPEHLLIVTNQGGIEKGHEKREAFAAKMEYLGRAIAEYCDCDVHIGYGKSNWKYDNYRKPQTGTLEYLSNKFLKGDIDSIKKASLMIGDSSGKPGDYSDIDIQTAKNFGIDYMDVDEFCDIMLGL